MLTGSMGHFMSFQGEIHVREMFCLKKNLLHINDYFLCGSCVKFFQSILAQKFLDYISLSYEYVYTIKYYVCQRVSKMQKYLIQHKTMYLISYIRYAFPLQHELAFQYKKKGILFDSPDHLFFSSVVRKHEKTIILAKRP